MFNVFKADKLKKQEEERLAQISKEKKIKDNRKSKFSLFNLKNN